MALLVFSATLINVVDADAFLKASHLKEERMSGEDVQTTLLAEVEGTFGEGSASSRVKQLEKTLGPMYAALPKNENGYLGHATVRYALHRLFVQRHGWSIKGLDAAGGHRNSTSGAGLLKEQVPAYIQDLFEERLKGRGFGLHELGVLAATIEHLVHNEAIKRLGNAFKVHQFLPTAQMTEKEADDVLDTYMTSYILGEDLSNMTLEGAVEVKEEMPELFNAWPATKEFVRKTRRDVSESGASTEQKASGAFDFSLVAKTAETVGERFGTFQDHECKDIKAALVKMEEAGSGRVRLSDFYTPVHEGAWQFQESVAYLKQLGALDESEADKPRVIIANYITAPANCIASSSFYSVCCMDECEGLLGHLEEKIAAPEATATQVAKLVSELQSSSVAAPRKLSSSLLDRLGEIAAHHGGTVQLHGRLFAQWMHHAYPRECPYPHLSGSTNPLTPDEWLESTGEETVATDEEMIAHNSTVRVEAKEEPAMPWSHEEELLVVRPAQLPTGAGSCLFSFMRKAVLAMATVSVAYALVRSSSSVKDASPGMKPEKYMV